MKEKKRDAYYYLYMAFIIRSMADVKILAVCLIVGVVLLPFYLIKKSEKRKREEREEQLANMRTKTVLAVITDIEAECKMGENSYTVVCEYRASNQKYMFQSMKVKDELELKIGQEIEVVIQPDNPDNHYVSINEYLRKAKYEPVMIRGIPLLKGDLQAHSEEKQIFITFFISVIYIACTFICLSLYYNIITPTQTRALIIILYVFIRFVKRKVDW